MLPGAAGGMQVERVTNHDVKAVEYVLKRRLAANAELAKVGHTGCRARWLAVVLCCLGDLYPARLAAHQHVALHFLGITGVH